MSINEIIINILVDKFVHFVSRYKMSIAPDRYIFLSICIYNQLEEDVFKDVRRHEASAYQDVSIAQGSAGMEKFDHLFPPTSLIAILVAPQRSAPWPPVSRYSLSLVPLNILLRSSSRPSRHRAIARNVGMRAMR